MQHFIFCVNYWISADRKDQIKVCSNLSDFTRSSEKFNCLLIFKCWKRLLWLHGSTSWNKYISKCVSKLCGYSCILRYTALQSSFVETFFFFPFPREELFIGMETTSVWPFSHSPHWDNFHKHITKLQLQLTT